MKWEIQTPARIEILGPSHSGKSVIVEKFLKDDTVWDRPPKNVIYCAPTKADRASYIALLEETCCNGGKELAILDKIPSIEEVGNLGEEGHALIIVDDLLSFKDAASLAHFAVMHSHHLDISIIFCVQNAFYKGAKLDLPTLSRNATMKVVLFQTADFLQYKMLSTRLFPERKSFLTDCLNLAKSRYGMNYVICNTHSFSPLPRNNIVYTAIFKEERDRFAGSPLFFDLEA